MTRTLHANWKFCAVAWCALVSAAIPNAAFALDAKDCIEEQTATLAIRACTALLTAPALDEDTRRRLLLRRGEAWLKEDEPGDAVADYTRILQVQPANVEALKGRARAQTVLANHAGAVKDWSAIIAASSKPADIENASFERGTSALAAQDAQMALADFAHVIELNPKGVKAHLGRASAFALLKDRDNEFKEFDLAQAADANDPSPFYARAAALERFGDVRGAIDNYMAGLRLNSRGGWDARKALKRLGVDSPP